MKKNSMSLILTILTLITTFILTIPPNAIALDLHGENDEYIVHIKIRPNIGYRRDSLTWNIAGDINGEGPNVLSELEYNDVVINQLGLTAHLLVNNIYLRGALYYGEITGGQCIDSDYNQDNRKDMFSRSVSEVSDDNTVDLGAGVGYLFKFFHARLQIAPLLGMAYHEQNLRVTNGAQTFGTADLTGLNSTYQSEWQSMWIGIDLMTTITKTLFFSVSSEYHDADYKAKADWNLRQDFQHPVSFVHYADGKGITFKAGLEKIFNDRWTIGISYIRQDWSTDPGIDKVFFTDGTTSSTRLNAVSWKSESLNLFFGYRF